MTVEIVLDGDIEEKADVTVGHLVEDLTPLLASSHETGQPELTKLMARGRLAGIDQTGQLADTELAALDEGIDHAEPSRVSEKLESLGEHQGRIMVEQIVRQKLMLTDWLGFSHVTHDRFKYLNINSDVQVSTCEPPCR